MDNRAKLFTGVISAPRIYAAWSAHWQYTKVRSNTILPLVQRPCGFVTIRSRWLAPPANFRASVRIRSFAFLAKPSKAHDVIRKITLPSVIICALALAVHFYAHHNWHPLPPERRSIGSSSKKRTEIVALSRRQAAQELPRCAGSQRYRPKEKEGDMKTPEGIYKIDSRNAQSSFHLALHISYPSDDDNTRAAERGVSAGF